MAKPTVFTHHESTRPKRGERKSKLGSQSSGTGGPTAATITHVVTGVNDVPCRVCWVVHPEDMSCDYGDGHIRTHERIAVLGARVNPGRCYCWECTSHYEAAPLVYERHAVVPAAVAAARKQAEIIRKRHGSGRRRIMRGGIV